MTINTLLEDLAGRSRHGQARRCAHSSTTLAGLCLLALMGGCVAPEPPKVAAPVAPIAPAIIAPTALSAEAEAALQAAEQSVIEARVKRALWTSAVDELGKARAAAKIFDSTATLAHAKEAVALCTLSVQQLTAAPVKW